MIMTLTRELEDLNRNSIPDLWDELEEATLWVSSQFLKVKITPSPYKIYCHLNKEMDLRLVLLLESLEFNNSFWHEFILPRKYPTLTEVCSLND